MSSDAKRRVTRLVTFILYGTGNFGLFTEIPVCKFLRGLREYSLKPLFFIFYILSIVCVYTFFLQLFVWRIVPSILLRIMRHRNVHYYYYVVKVGNLPKHLASFQRLAFFKQHPFVAFIRY